MLWPELAALLTASLLGACGGLRAAATDAGYADAGGSACSPINATRACTCGAAAGRSTCLSTGFGPCQCDAPASTAATASVSVTDADGGTAVLAEPLGNARVDIVFDWERTVPSSGTCEPGHYVGQTTCDFQALGLALGPIPSTLDFTLGKATGGEVLKITVGKISSVSAAGTVQNGDLVGELDCATATFDAHIENGTISAYGASGKITGTLHGEYDKVTHQLVNGIYDGAGDIAGLPGGCLPGSTWSAQLQP